MRTLLKKRYSIPIGSILLLAVILFIIKIPRYYVPSQDNTGIEWGVTFSKKYAQELDLDWKEVYKATLEDLKVDHVRIPVYWDDIERSRSSIDLTDYKYMLDLATENNTKVVLAIGERLPRWPECHIPDWVDGLSVEDHEKALFNMLEVVVKSFTEYDIISHWQVENEPLVEWFGECDAPDANRVKREIALVRMFDDRPIIITDSGELSLWRESSKLGGNFLGITTYRVTWNKWFKFVRYPFHPSFYRLKALLANVPWENIIIVELQAEPWIPGTKGLVETPLDIQYHSMNLEQFQANINYAKALNASQTYLWGVEWWYWLSKKGDNSILDEAQLLWEQ